MPVTAQSEDSAALVARTLEKIGEIATLPEVTVRIIELVDDPRGTARDLQAVILRDPALSARVLKVVNSAFYGLPGQVASVDRAIVLLGQSAIKNIAIAASMSRLLRGGLDENLLDAKAVWRHSVAVALVSRKMAVLVGEPAVDECFLAGLIHDLGLMILCQALPHDFAAVVRAASREDTAFLIQEQRIIGATHEDFGGGLARQWKFPANIQAAVGGHHHPEEHPEATRRFGWLVHCADVACCTWQLGFSLTNRFMTLDADLLAQVGITPEQLEQINEQLGPELDEAEAMLSGGGAGA